MTEVKAANSIEKSGFDNEYLLSYTTERKFWDFLPKKSNLYGFIFILNGSISYELNNTGGVLNAGDVLFFKPTDNFSVAALSEAPHTVSLSACPGHIFENYVNIYGSQVLNKIFDEKEAVIIHASNAEQTAISQRIEQFLFFKNIPQSGAFFKKVIFHRLLELLLQSRLNITPQNPHFYIIDLLKNIDQNQIVINGIAAILERTNVSHEHLCRIMKKSLGITPLDYVTNIRMQRACELLLHTENDISSIALLTGYSSQSHFISAFKKKYSLTPAAYRKINL